MEIVLREPEKDELARYERGKRSREASVILLNRSAETTTRRSCRWARTRCGRPVPGVQAAITLEEYFECEQAVRADPRFREAPASRD